MLRKVLSLVLVSILFPTASLSAVQGSVGTLSSGNIGLTVKIPTRTHISEPTASLPYQTNQQNNASTVCMTPPSFSETTTNYSMKLLGQGNAENPHAFTVSDGEKELGYSVHINHIDSHLKVQAGHTLVSNTSQHGTTCGMNKTDISLEIDKDHTASSAVYLGALTFIMIPE